MTAEDPYMVGTCVGSGVGSLQELESAYEKIMTKGPNRVSPFTVPMMISNIAAGNIAIQLGCKERVLMLLQHVHPVQTVSVKHSVQFSMEMQM